MHMRHLFYQELLMHEKATILISSFKNMAYHYKDFKDKYKMALLNQKKTREQARTIII